MTKSSKAERGLRLHREALNCLAIAVRERDPTNRALLIDEAIRLERRSGELATPRETAAVSSGEEVAK